LSTIRAANRNIAVKSTVDMMQKVAPDLIQPADTKWNGKIQEAVEPRNPDQAMLVYMKDGKPEAFYVPKGIAESFDRNPIADEFITKMSRKLANPFRWVFTQYNPGFWIFNFAKDYNATVKKTPGLTTAAPGVAGRIPLWVYYLKSAGANYASVTGRANEMVKEMRDNNALISMESMRDLDPQDMNIERMLKRWQLDTGGHKTAWQQFGKFFSHIDNIGNFIEMWPKAATWKYLSEKQPDMPMKEKAHFVRTRAGSPPFLIKGKYTPLLNNVMIYSNAMAQGWKADIEAIKSDPVQYAWTTAKLAVAPTLLLAAAAGGLLGEKQKKLVDNVREYDKTNYTIIPMGQTKSGKTVYLRVPRDETSRFIGGLLWKGLHLGEDGKLMQVVDYTAGQIPGPTPYIEAMGDVVQYASGKNPYDAFRGRYAIPERIFEAGGKESLERFAKYEANNLGLSVIYRFDTDDIGEIKTTLEKALRFPLVNNIVGRFLKVSDQGKGEQIRNTSKSARQTEARRRLDVRESIVEHINSNPSASLEKLQRLFIDLKTKGTLPRDQSFRQFFKMYDRYKIKKEGDPEMEAFIYSASNVEKRAMLEYFKTNKKSVEFTQLVKKLREEGLISAELAGVVMKSQTSN